MKVAVVGNQLDEITFANASAEGVLAIPAMGPFVGHSGDDWHTDPNAHLRFIVFSIGGRTMMIYIEAPQVEWGAFLADANQVLSTVQFVANTP